jgi:diguanylate cyclase (GGDEF)-like protein
LNEVDTPFTPSQGQRRIDRSYAEDVRGWQGQRDILEALDELVGRIPPAILFAACLVIAAVPGLLDRDLADGFSISIFYLVAVAVAAWYGGGRLGYSMAGVSALASLVTDLAAGHEYGSAISPFCNVVVTFGFLVVLARLLAFQRGRLRRERETARVDRLTGVRTQAGFFSDTEILWGLGMRQGHATSLAYLDLDNFKLLNDTRGHAAGDSALKAVATTLVETVRSTDVVGRLGGDEFALLLPETSSEGAALVLERVHDRVRLLAQEHGWPITVSIGAVVIRPPYPTLAEALRAADQLMYRAKEAGKSGVMIEPAGQSDAGDSG